MSSVSLAFQAYLQQVESDKLKALQEKAGIKPIPDELAETYNYGTSPSIGPIPGPLGLAPPTQQFQNQKYYPQDQLPEDDIISIEEAMAMASSELFERPSKIARGKKYTLNDLEADAEFQERSERFMEETSQNEDIFEYLRDPNFSVGKAFQRSVDIGGWSEQAKEDYIWLQDKFENAELGGWKQTMGMIKDLSIDLITDPFNILAMAFVPATLGQSLTVNAALKTATAQGLKKLSKTRVKRLGAVAKEKALRASPRAAKLGMAEGAAFTGAHDFFLQGAEKELGLRENIDLTQTALSTGIGGAFGGALGGATGFFTAYSPMLKAQIFRNSNEGAIINETNMPAGQLRKEITDEEQITNFINIYKNDSQARELGNIPKVIIETKTPKGKAWARYNKKDNTIYYNEKVLEQKFKDKAWTKPKKKGVSPLNFDAFNSLEEFKTFILYHETAHSLFKRQAKESAGAYENRMNKKAFEVLNDNGTNFTAGFYNIWDETVGKVFKRKKALPEGEEEVTPGWLKKAALGYFGKSVAELALAADKSPVLQKFLSRIRHDYQHTLTKGVRGVQSLDTFEENVSEMQARWLIDLDDAIQPLFRQTFKDGENWKAKWANVFGDNLDYDQNQQLLRLLWEPDAKQINYLSPDGKKIVMDIKDVHPDIKKAALRIKKVLKNARIEAKNAGLLEEYQFLENYFPRQFQHDKILQNKDKFISIIRESTHSSPLNVYTRSDYNLDPRNMTFKGRFTKEFSSKLQALNINKKTRASLSIEELETLSKNGLASLKEDATFVDQRVFGRDFILEAMQELGYDETKIKLLYSNVNRAYRKNKKGEELIDYKDQKEILDSAKRIKAEQITEDILAKRDDPFYQTAYTAEVDFKRPKSPGAFKSRIFDEIPDEAFAEFVDTDVRRVLSNYFINSARTIQRSRLFGKSESEFERRFLAPMKGELKKNGVNRKEREIIENRAKLLYERVTGLDVPTWDVGKNKIIKDPKLARVVKVGTDWAKISQQLAHLPLATLSSITEPLILLSRLDTPNVFSKQGYEAISDVGSALVKGIQKDLNRWARVRAKFQGKKVRGLEDINDADWKELYKVGLALEQATMQRLEGLYGEAASGGFARGVQNAFFHANLLTQWTGAVQLAAFTTGKRLIRETSEKLYNDRKGIQKLSTREKQRAIDRLNEGGIEEWRAIQWYEQSLNKNGEFDEAVAQGLHINKNWKATRNKKGMIVTPENKKKFQMSFYNNYYQRSAARFAKEIILVPTTAAANRPLWHSHPAGQLFAQFAGYPTAFNNTILKRMAREMYTDPMQASPKILSTVLLMTSVATLMNGIRSQGASFKGEPGEIITRGIQRWGGMGPLEVAYRYKTNAGFGSGQFGSLLKAPAGPLAQDAVDMLIYRKGLAEMAINNLPGSAAFPMLFGDNYRNTLAKHARNFDKATWGRFFGPVKRGTKPKKIDFKSIAKGYGYKFGGEVNIPNAVNEPDEKIDRVTGLPYNQQAGILGQDEEERLGFSTGGLGAAIRRVFHGSPWRFNKFRYSKIGTGEGFQARGLGFYFAESLDLAKKYARDLVESKKDALDALENRIRKGFKPEELSEYLGEEAYKQRRILGFEDDPKGFMDMIKVNDLVDMNHLDSVYNEFLIPYISQGKDLKKFIDSDEWINLHKQIKESVYDVRLRLKDNQILDDDKLWSEQHPDVQRNLFLTLRKKRKDDPRNLIINDNELIDELEKLTGKAIREEQLQPRFIPLEEALAMPNRPADAEKLARKRYVHPGSGVMDMDIAQEQKLLQDSGIKGVRFLSAKDRAKGFGQSNWVVADTRLIEIAKVFGVSIPVAASIAYQLESGATVDDIERQGFKEGGAVKDNTEVMSYLTKASRLAAPYLDDGEPLRIYTKEEIKDYPKGITQTVYRHLKEGTEIEHLEDFELTDKVGVSVHTYKDKHQAGKIRIYNPLDLRKKEIEDFRSYRFMDRLIKDKQLQNTIVKHSKLTKPEAQERIKDLIAEYRFAVKAIADDKALDDKDVEYALNVKVGKEAKDILNELGYDSILYTKKDQEGTCIMLFEPGQFRAVEGSAPIQSETDGQMESLGFEREQYFTGGVSQKLFLKPFIVDLLNKKYGKKGHVKKAYQKIKDEEAVYKAFKEEKGGEQEGVEFLLKDITKRLDKEGLTEALEKEYLEAINMFENLDSVEKRYLERIKLARKNFEDSLRTEYIIDKKAGKSSILIPDEKNRIRHAEGGLFKRRQYFLGGTLNRLLDRVINTKAERIRKGPAPLAFRQMFHDLAGGRDELTEADLRKDEIRDFTKIIREGMKDGTIKKVGRNKWTIGYDAYKTHDESKGETKYADINFKTGIHKIIPKLNDSNFNFKTTIGQATLIKDKNGNFIVKDQYNFNDSPGLKLQQYFTTPEGRETLGHFLKGTRYNVTRQMERAGFRPEDEVKEGESRLYPVKVKDKDYGKLAGNRPFGFKPLYGQVRNFMGHFGSGTGQGSMININLGNLEDPITKPTVLTKTTKPSVSSNIEDDYYSMWSDSMLGRQPKK